VSIPFGPQTKYQLKVLKHTKQKLMTLRQFLYYSMLPFLMIGCSEQNSNHSEERNEIFVSTKNEKPGKYDAFETEVVFNINGISTLDTFNLKKYIEVIGKPDSIKRGGDAIIKEFGHDDYQLWYNNSWISAGHGYLLAAEIKNPGILVNGIQVGDSQTQIDKVFKIPRSDSDTIKVRNQSDCILTFHLNNNVIKSIYFWMPL